VAHIIMSVSDWNNTRNQLQWRNLVTGEIY